MFNFPSEEDERLNRLLRQIDEEHDDRAQIADLEAMLAAIDNPQKADGQENGPEIAQAPRPRPRGFVGTFQDPDPNDPDVIIEQPKLTPYDRRRMELRELEAKRDAILAGGEVSDDDQRRLAALAPLINEARKRFDLECKRATDDLWRERRSIDDWRAGEGREERNKSRRKVRTAPNADLSAMTPEEKAQYGRDRRSDTNWFSRRRKKGESEASIAAAYAERLELRRRERAAMEELHSHPDFGKFS